MTAERPDELLDAVSSVLAGEDIEDARAVLVFLLADAMTQTTDGRFDQRVLSEAQQQIQAAYHISCGLPISGNIQLQ